MPENLFTGKLVGFDPHELRIALDEFVGGPGQYQNKATYPNKFCLPLAGETCKIILTYKEGVLSMIEAGPALKKKEWEEIVVRIESALLDGPMVVGRNLSFSIYRVKGSWRGVRSGVQILPPPDDAPTAPVEIAEHPFILEFPMKQSTISRLSRYRWFSTHRRLTLILNLALNGHTSSQLRRAEHHWALVEKDDGKYEAKWVQCSYFAKYGKAILEALSPASEVSLPEIEPTEYYASFGHDGEGLRLPSDLDDLISTYYALPKESMVKFDRSAFWMDLASRQWEISISSSFASLVSAIESLTERGQIHSLICPKCDKPREHEVPGPTKKFVDFFETYAPGQSNKKRRDKMYKVRSDILHGSDLLQIDQDINFGWDPPGWDQRELTNELWTLTRIALRQWLKDKSTK